MRQRAYEYVLQALPFAGLVMDFTGDVLFANAETRELTGRSSEELIGKRFFAEFEFFGGSEEVESRYRDGVARGALSFFYVGEHLAPGESVPLKLKVHLNAFQDEGQPLGLAVLEPLPGHEQLQREIQELEDCLHAVNGIRHEINNLLMGLMGRTELLQDSAGLDGGTRDRVVQILDESRRVQQQVRQLGSVVKR
ncbi:MAG: PAS domain-containing protein [bacterium]|nr:PAS domain-containing protein [bacterium]